ncbi:MAG: 16S rRNA (cytosine(1402)-N(4))-methyltransferase RsmH [Clostridiaceae bacterium]|nr:16S rRNA (cytosine(1402)-N(4))-methyltransferase RsmH [Clostridiaceae bacterium]
MSGDSDFRHISVLYNESLEHLAIKPDGLYVDCTLGGGGHSSGILEALGSQGRLIAFDKDADARAAAKQRLNQVQSEAKFDIAAADFSDLEEVLQDMGIQGVDGILADLGVSSWQLDQAERGFSYGQDGPLDMRMDISSGQTAADIVNTESAEQIAWILKTYGEERYARRLAEAIVRRRMDKPFARTGEFAELIRQAMPSKALKEKQHPARRTFQALRIAVNHELDALEKLLEIAPDMLNEGGRLCIITFHSLEDRMVKEAFRRWENPCTCPRSFPVCICGNKPLGKQIDRKGIIADISESESNARARSARLRCFERSREEELQI